MKLILLAAAVTTEIKEDVAYILVGFDLTTDAPGGKRYGATRSIPMTDADEYRKPYEEICYKVLVEMGKMFAKLKKVLPNGFIDNEDDMPPQMRDLMIEGLTAFFSTGEWWTKRLCEVHDIKAGSTIMDMAEHKQYTTENDIRVITKV